MWESTADSTFSVRERGEEEDDLGRGTKIVLSLKEDCLEFLEEERLKGLIKRYSEFINFPIYLYTTKEEEEEVPVEEGDAEDESEEEEVRAGPMRTRAHAHTRAQAHRRAHTPRPHATPARRARALFGLGRGPTYEVLTTND